MTTTNHGTTQYPDQLTLPGQAAAPGGPVDMKMMYLMHHGFRRDLNRFASAVEVTPVDDRRTWTALADRWDRFFEVLHHHHSGEDAGIWPFLLERADTDERATLEAMEEEHSHIDPLLTSCAEGFAAMAGDRVGIDAEDVRAALKVRVAATRDALSRHLAHEESEAMVILQRHMTREDWEHIEVEHFRKKETFARLRFMVCWLAEDLADSVRKPLFDEAGLGMKVLWRLSRPSFDRLEQRAFTHVL
jgi:hemerythrin-like domain-containing protein